MNTLKVKKWKLSEVALEFTKLKSEQKKSTKNSLPMAIRYLEYWMDHEKIKLVNMNRVKLEQFEQSLTGVGLSHSSKNAIRIYLQRYFKWLESKELIHGKACDIFIRMGIEPTRRQVVLPQEAIQFLTVMGIQIKADSVKVYKTTLNIFYHYMQKNDLNIKNVKKAEMDNFLIYLAGEKLANNTRRSQLIRLRNYLRWLYNSEITDLEPDQLILYREIPKREQKLPRPLPTDIDRELQTRLGKSRNILHQGLLVMRRTGIRIGELTALKYDCLKTDMHGHSFLKVELGKLYTERLVPLHEDTVILIKKIQEETGRYYHCPEKLIHLECGRQPVKREFMLALNEITYGFKTKKPIVSHQFRHSFACEMLNCGMSLVVLKEILGHKDIKMTLQYATVTQGTIREEFIKAYRLISKQYELPVIQKATEFRPEKALEEIISYLKKVSLINSADQQKLTLINRRLFRIKNELSGIQN